MKTRYFQAIAKPEKPFVVWMSVGDFTDDEFAASDYATDPLVVKESEVAPYNFGVSTVKIVSGELVALSPAELAVYETQFNLLNKLKANKNSIDVLDTASFDYDGKSFPMDAGSRLFYDALEKLTGDKKMMTMEGLLYNLIDANRTAFMTAYYTRLLTLTQPEV